MNQLEEITQLLQQAQDGDQQAEHRLIDLIYGELRGQAARLVRNKGPFAESTSLVHEGYARLFGRSSPLDLKNRRYFFTAAIDQMRKILCERCRVAAKKPHTQLDQYADQFLEDFRRESPFEFQALHDTLKRFRRSRNARKRRRHQLIEYVYFGGLTIKEAAELLDISYRQARDDKRLAEAELYQEIIAQAP